MSDVHSVSMQAPRQTLDQGQQPSDTLPTLNPASSTHSTARLHTNWTLDEDGWVLEERYKLLVWVPPDVRGLLLRPRTLAIISWNGSLALGFADAKLGDDWRHCYQS